jgi:tight adherence protein B
VLLVILVVFLAVFVLIALLFTVAGGAKPSRQTRATLASVLKSSRTSRDEEVVDVRKNHLLSSIPWVNHLLIQIKAAIRLRVILEQADLQWTPGRLIFTSVAAWWIAAYLIHLRMAFGAASLLPALAAGLAPYLYVMRRRRRRFTQFQAKLPDTLDLMVSALRAGHSMSGALGTAAKEAPEPIGRELRLCFEEQNFGIDLRTAMQNLMERIPLQDVRIITTAMLIHKESGGNLAEVLDKTAYVIRERFRIQQQIRVHTAQGRLSGWVLSLLPVALATLMYMLNPTYISVLFAKPLGHKIILVAATMNVIGLLIIRKIVNIRV